MAKVFAIILFFIFVGSVLVGYTLLVFRQAGDIDPTPKPKRGARRKAVSSHIGHHLQVIRRLWRWRIQAAR